MLDCSSIIASCGDRGCTGGHALGLGCPSASKHQINKMLILVDQRKEGSEFIRCHANVPDCTCSTMPSQALVSFHSCLSCQRKVEMSPCSGHSCLSCVFLPSDLLALAFPRNTRLRLIKRPPNAVQLSASKPAERGRAAVLVALSIQRMALDATRAETLL